MYAPLFGYTGLNSLVKVACLGESHSEFKLMLKVSGCLTVQQVLLADQADDTFSATAERAISKKPVVAIRAVPRQNGSGEPLQSQMSSVV